MQAANENTLKWRRMEAGDLASVTDIAADVHTDFHEDDIVFLERLKLYPDGCLVLEGAAGRLFGYAISHPWLLYSMPALNSALGRLPDVPTTYYLHDIALLPQSRGTGSAGTVVSILVGQAVEAGLSTMSLVAVNGSAGFWQKNGFKIVSRADLQPKLKTYSDDACFMLRQLQ